MRFIFFGINLFLMLCFLFVSGCSTTKTTTQPVSASPSSKITILYVTSDQVNLRVCPSSTCKVTAVLKRGDEILKLGQENDWMNIRVKTTNHEGWVASRFVGKKPKSKTSTEINEEGTPHEKDKQRSLKLKEEFSP
jgi:uncharacterized protein YgiM (DUF1202 family)